MKKRKVIVFQKFDDRCDRSGRPYTEPREVPFVCVEGIISRETDDSIEVESDKKIYKRYGFLGLKKRYVCTKKIHEWYAKNDSNYKSEVVNEADE